MGSLTPLIDLLRNALALLFVLPILIAVHELGHFWVARAFGMKVDAFAVMIGGVRKTSLEKYLKKPLAPAWQVGVFAIVSHAVLLIGAIQQSMVATVVGLFLVGVVLAIWVVSRLGALYHLTPATSLGTLFKTWGVAIVLSFFGTRFQGMAPLQLLGLIAIASFVGAAIVYYQPVLHKSEESPHGHGHLDLPTDAVQGASDATSLGDGYSRLPVSFRPLASRTDKRGTEYSLLCWPLGGFAAIKGMHPKEDGSETKVEGGFYSKSPFARLLVLFAGPFFSMGFGVLVLTGLLIIAGDAVPSLSPVVGTVGVGGPAEKAGLKSGDRIVAVNGTTVKVFFDVLKEVRSSVRKVGQEYVPVPVQLTVERGNQRLQFSAVPDVDVKATPVRDEHMLPTKEKAIQAKLQISPIMERQRMALGPAFSKAAMQPVDLVTGLLSSVTRPAEMADNVGGPAAIAQAVGQAAKSGIDDLLTIAALLSISLGVMNLLPIGPLDGGQMVVAFTEMLRGGRRLSYPIQMKLTTVGAFLVMALVLCVVTLDIGRTVGK